MKKYTTDILIVGGGAAGLYAGICAKQKNPQAAVTIAEKANVFRSGCLAMGLNAINLYLNDSNVDSYVDYVKQDSLGIVRDDLVRTIGEKANEMAHELKNMGVDIPQIDNEFISRSKRSIRMNGENIKECMARAAQKAKVNILNHHPVYSLATDMNNTRVQGAAGFNIFTGEKFRITAKATILCTGGAAGIYRPTNPGLSRKKGWYCPYNNGAGLAMGIRLGAEMTSFEHRFIPLRTKDVVAPTGTLAFNKPIRQTNSKGEQYLKQIKDMLGRKLTTSERLYYTVKEHQKGLGPCLMDLSMLTDEEYHLLAKDYLNMAPTLSLLMKGSNKRIDQIEVIGSEPYVNGGHGLSGFWVDTQRRTTVAGLYAAGDIAGGSSKKYLTGCMVEAQTAAFSALNDIDDFADIPEKINWNDDKHLCSLSRQNGPTYVDLEDRLQKIMEEYAGGSTQFYEYSESKLKRAQELLKELKEQSNTSSATDPWQAAQICEAQNLIDVAQVLTAHMLARKETRWRAYQERLDYPLPNNIEFMCFINSRQKNNKLEVFKRSLLPPYKKGGLYA